MAVAHIAFVMYPVSDVPRAVAFYENLGLKKSGVEAPYWVEFDVAGATFGIGNFEQVGKPGTAQSLALEVADLAEFRSTLAARGITATEPHALANCSISTVSDPDGNHVWLHEVKPK